MPKRKQLTIFINDGESEPIERIRKKFNIQQFNLIASHITLCREDEIEDLDYVLHKLSNLKFSAFEVSLGTPKRFYEGKGVFIPVIDSSDCLENLRKQILPMSKIIEPHITIMHPRNSTCTDEIFQEIIETTIPTKIILDRISLIEQEIGKKWNILQTFNRKGNLR
ncbi:MAG: 2'-5' RNA ligase family protein [Bacteroidota bacterium]